MQRVFLLACSIDQVPPLPIAEKLSRVETPGLNIHASTLACGTGRLATIKASLDGGSCWITLFSETGAIVQANYTLSVPSGQNLALVQVQFNCSGDATLTGYIDLYFNSLYIE